FASSFSLVQQQCMLLSSFNLIEAHVAGVGRCVSELSSSSVQTLRLRRCKFAIRMKEDFFWVRAPPARNSLYFSFLFKNEPFFDCECVLWKALGCSMEVPTESVCELLDHLINLFCFYNGSVRQSYQVWPV
ncbi:hypothetical protein GOODEAATRI_019345, partial [Goodea atripinnis]